MISTVPYVLTVNFNIFTLGSPLIQGLWPFTLSFPKHYRQTRVFFLLFHTTATYTVGDLLTQSTVWQDMSKPLYSGCEQDTVACERTWSELASWTLHSAIAKKQNRRSTTSSRTVPSGGNRDTSYGRRMSQPPTSCGELRKTCAAQPSSWQHVDWGSKHGWSTTEEEEEEGDLLWMNTRMNSFICLWRHDATEVSEKSREVLATLPVTYRSAGAGGTLQTSLTFSHWIWIW